MSAPPRFSPGIQFGPQAFELLSFANEENFAIPLLTVNTTSGINAALEAAAAAGSPIGLQFDEQGSSFFAGAGLSDANSHAAVVGAVAGALYVHTMAKAYGVPVLLGTASIKPEQLPWLDGLLQASADFFAQRNMPLFTAHHVDLSSLPFEENLGKVKEYLKKTAGLNMHLLITLGSAAQLLSEDNQDEKDEADQYTSPMVFARAFEELHAIHSNFAFTGILGKLDEEKKQRLKHFLPLILKNAQTFIKTRFNLANDLPLLFAARLDQDTEQPDIEKAIEYGAVLVNVDMLVYDALWEGVGSFVAQHMNESEETSEPDKHFTNPAQWMRAGEQIAAARLGKAFEMLGAVGRLV